MIQVNFKFALKKTKPEVSTNVKSWKVDKLFWRKFWSKSEMNYDSEMLVVPCKFSNFDTDIFNTICKDQFDETYPIPAYIPVSVVNAIHSNENKRTCLCCELGIDGFDYADYGITIEFDQIHSKFKQVIVSIPL